MLHDILGHLDHDSRCGDDRRRVAKMRRGPVDCLVERES
jgi:hypothetical protein